MDRCFLNHNVLVIAMATGLHEPPVILRLELSIDNVNVIEGQSPLIRPEGGNLKDRKLRVCIANLYSRFGIFDRFDRFSWRRSAVDMVSLRS